MHGRTGASCQLCLGCRLGAYGRPCLSGRCGRTRLNGRRLGARRAAGIGVGALRAGRARLARAGLRGDGDDSNGGSDG